MHVVLDDENVESAMRIVRIFRLEHEALLFAWKRAMASPWCVTRIEQWEVAQAGRGPTKELLSRKMCMEWGAGKVGEVRAALEQGIIHDLLKQYTDVC